MKQNSSTSSLTNLIFYPNSPTPVLKLIKTRHILIEYLKLTIIEFVLGIDRISDTYNIIKFIYINERTFDFLM